MPNITCYMSNETIITLDEQRAMAIAKHATNFGIEAALIRAIIAHESMQFHFAFRIDYKSLKKQAWYLKTLSFEEKKNKRMYSSYGDMQILYGLAKLYGFRGAPEELFNADTNIYYGCKHLEWLIKRYHGRIKDVIHAYNWGSNAWNDLDGDKKHDANETYKNQEYVDSVYKKYKKFGGVK